MRKFIGVVLAGLLAAGTGTAPATAEGGTANAIISEGNGAAVFIGYGGERSVALQWRPSKNYDAATLLYQVQRSDGAMLESKKQVLAYTDINLQPNTFYTYILTTYQLVEKTAIVKKQRITKTYTKVLGKNQITVLTYPGMVVNFQANTDPSSFAFSPGSASGCVFNSFLTWEPPQNSEKAPISYTVRLNGNVMAYGLGVTSYKLLNLPTQVAQNVQVYAENATGLGVQVAALNVGSPRGVYNTTLGRCVLA